MKHEIMCYNKHLDIVMALQQDQLFDCVLHSNTLIVTPFTLFYN